MKKAPALLLLVGLLVLCNPAVSYAHGVKFQYEGKMTYEILAQYDDGTPMSAAQVIIYAPDNPQTPWLKSSCDEEGKYYFAPDSEIKGNWTVQFRQAGHGGNVHINVGEENTSTASSGRTGYSPLQVIIMIIAVVWGLIGTALYFKREK